MYIGYPHNLFNLVTCGNRKCFKDAISRIITFFVLYVKYIAYEIPYGGTYKANRQAVSVHVFHMAYISSVIPTEVEESFSFLVKAE